jgi:nucleoside-diphosphate-sugar epimerase
MEILITGGNGLLGHHLVPALQERGARVRVLALPAENTSALEQRHVALYRGDVRHPDTLAAPLHGVDTVFHLAGLMGVWRPLRAYYAVNVTGTEHVCRAALAAGVRRLVHVSSWTVYGMALGQPAREDFPLRPFPEPYAVSKAQGDRVVQRLIVRERLPAVIIRPGTFFGPGDRLHFGRMAERLCAGRGLVVGRGRNALPFVYVTDVVQGLLLAAEREQAAGQAYNITHDQPLTQEAFLRALAQELGVAPPWLHAPYHALYAAAWAAEQAARLTPAQRQPVVTRLGVKLFGTDNRHAIDKARRELGYTPRVSLREGVGLAAAWYRAAHRDERATPPMSRPVQV